MSEWQRAWAASRVSAGIGALLAAWISWQCAQGALYGVPSPIMNREKALSPPPSWTQAPLYTSPEQAAVMAVLAGLMVLVFLWLALRPNPRAR